MLRPCGDGHARRSEATCCAHSKESMMITAHRAEACVDTSDRESSGREIATQRCPPLWGVRACMMPAASAAVRKTTLVTSDMTGQVCIEAGVAAEAGGLLPAAASLAESTFAGELASSAGCVGEVDISR
eukprot:6214420-Pleurochrysis_carterae.AAC.2